MGKRLISQRRGKGSHTFKAKLRGINSLYLLKTPDVLVGEVTNFVKENGRNAIMAEITFADGRKQDIIAVEGMHIGQKVEQGRGASVNLGNISELGALPEGCPVCNVERTVNDGGKLVRASGSYALLVAKDHKAATLKMPSGSMIKLPLDVRATIGNVSCGGKQDKPMVKAGNMFHAMKARKKMWPRVRGVKMNAVDHPFGGASHHPGKSKSTSRNAPPGRKVGAIASSRTGRRKKG